LFVVVVSHLNDALSPFILRAQLIQDGHRIVGLNAFDARHILQTQYGLAINQSFQPNIHMGCEDCTMGFVHVRQEHIAHPKDGAHREHSRGDAQHCQERARFVMPDVKPDLMPDDAHF
jgi:hypothetical protein